MSSARLSDYTNDGTFANEGSYPRMSDYSGSGGSDLFRSDVLSPSYQRDTGSPFSETSRDISREVPPLHKSDADNSKFHPQVISGGITPKNLSLELVSFNCNKNTSLQ